MTRITVRGEVDEKAVEQLRRCAVAGDAPIAAVSADGHYGYSLCIGGAVGYRDFVSPSGVGYDIGCGNLAIATDLMYSDVHRDVPAIMDEVMRRIAFGMTPASERTPDHPCLDAIRGCEDRAVQSLAQKATAQLGSVGGGNHYVDLFRDEHTDRVWVGVHFGSRGFGHSVANGFLARAQGLQFDERPLSEKGETGQPKRNQMDAEPTLLHVDSPLAHAYIEAMELAGGYAYAGREIVCEKVLDILGAHETFSVHNHHNYCWYEEHVVDGAREKLWVVRKGCTPAFPGQLGFVGATMGEPSVILEGVESDAGPDLLYSTVHGAGRVMSRTRAAGKSRRRWVCNTRDCEWVQPPKTHRPEACPVCSNTGFHKEMVQFSEGEIDWAGALHNLQRKNIELRGGAADEAPLAYKRLDDVLDYHADTICVKHRLLPIGVAMAGADITPDD